MNTDTVKNVPGWHSIPQAEVAKRLAANPETGLNLSEASVRLQKYGPNRLPEGRKSSPFRRFFVQFNNILVYLLLAAGFTKLMLSLWIDAGIIFAVVVLNALLGFIQEIHGYGYRNSARKLALEFIWGACLRKNGMPLRLWASTRFG